MGVTLETVQNKFACIIGELCSEPDILSEFAIWLDLRLAEYKAKGAIQLECSGESPDPTWLRGHKKPPKRIKSPQMERLHHYDFASHYNKDTPPVGSERLSPHIVVVKEEHSDITDAFPVNIYSHKNFISADLPNNSGKRPSIDDSSMGRTGDNIPYKMQRLSPSTSVLEPANQSLMSIISEDTADDSADMTGNLSADVSSIDSCVKVETSSFIQSLDPVPSTSSSESTNQQDGSKSEADNTTNMVSTGGDAAQPTSKSHFASVNPNDFGKLLREKDSLNTRKATGAAVRLFRQYLQERGYPEEFEAMTPEILDDYLCKFYVEARNKTGQLYKKTTLTALRHGINRHLKNTDIVNGCVFKKSKEAFSAMIAQLKREGFGGVGHHPPMEKRDLEKLYSFFDINCPESIQQKVFVDILLYFGRRGRENLRDLKISDFNCTQDVDGDLYIYLKKDTKNDQTDTNSADGRMYEVRNADERCPVKTFVRYKSLLPPGCNCLFPKVRKHPNKEGFYFDNTPMGHNKLGKMLRTLSEKAGLSRIYNNQSLRISSVYLLDSARVPTRQIMTITGHNAESSFGTGHTDDSSKWQMSDTVSSDLDADVKRVKAESCENSD